MEHNAGTIAVISILILGSAFLSPLYTHLIQAQPQPQPQLQKNETTEAADAKFVGNQPSLGKDVENEIDQVLTNNTKIHAKINNTELLENVSKDFIKAFPDMKATPQVVVAENDMVAVLWNFNGTHKGTYLGIPATGKPVSFKMAEFMKISNGKIKEYWPAVDDTDLLLKIGYLVHHNETNTTTTTKP
jgi:steroid delta-isomerase-like uncharacterized protein